MKILLILIACLTYSSLIFSQQPKAYIKSKSTENESVTVDWGQAQWIGIEQDDRPDRWSCRALTRNSPPHNIHEWVPTKDELKSQIRKTHPSSMMRKDFVVDKTLVSAEVAVCGLGLYELYINGSRVGDRVLDPAQTSYEKRAFYVTYDVKSFLQKDKNALGLMLGNGFYGQNMAFAQGLQYGAPRALLVLSLTYTDGSKAQIVSDDSWKVSTGPILFDNIYLGETYDARQEIKDWNQPFYNDSAWSSAVLMDVPTLQLQEQKLEPMRKIRTVEPIAVLPAENGWIIDMGQNMTGWLKIAVEESAGTVVEMRFAELLMPDKKNIDPASTGIHVTGNVQQDFYICKGEGVEEWEPRFTYHGFRYVQISGLSEKPKLEDFTGWLVRTDVARIGTFECSDDLINKFYNVSMWTIEDNLQGILTDCPHRERCAWLGDTYVVGEAASYNFDLDKFWKKIVEDIETTLGKQRPHPGDSLPRDPRAPCNIAVGKRLCLQARPDWGAATIMVPWFSYVHYGNDEIFREAWPMMTNWMAYLDEIVVQDGIITQGYGDWCPPGGNTVMDTPPSLTSTALYYQSLIAMQKMALLMDDAAASKEYAKKAVLVKAAFNKKFFDSKTYSYGSQTGNAFALHSGLAPEGKEQRVADRLADFVMKDSKGHYSTGIFGHRPLYTVLNDYGHSDVTEHLWRITDFPSLGFLTEVHDLTTWPETPYDWPIGKRYRRNSFNHPMQSGFSATFHESLGGIRPDSEHPAYKHFFLRPTFLSKMEWATVTLQSPQGEIISSWKRANDYVEWTVKVPNNSTAQVQLPAYNKKVISLNGKKVKMNRFDLKPGIYTIQIKE